MPNLDIEPPPSGNPVPSPTDEAGLVLRELQAALAEILDRLTPPALRASQLRDSLGLSQQVSWGIFTAAQSRTPDALVSLLPGRRAMEGFFAAAQLRGVPLETIATTRALFERFEEMVARHAGNRDAFRSMVAAEPRQDADDGALSIDDTKHKRAAFRASAVLWGRQVRVGVLARIMHPGQTPGLLDGIGLIGSIGLRRTRRTAPFHVATGMFLTPTGDDPSAPISFEMLDKHTGGLEPLDLLREFCSRPLPELRPISGQAPGSSHRGYELVNERLGASGECTFFMGHIQRGGSSLPGVGGSSCEAIRTITVPTETVVIDMLMHKSIWDRTPPQVQVYSWRIDGKREFLDSDLLPVSERGEYLGDGINVARTPLVPRYVELLSFAIGRAGWNPDDFHVFRCQVDYPVMYSRIRVQLTR